MSYVKHTWQTGEVIDAEKLNHMEDGIAAGGSAGGRGADWDAAEGEDGYIENKPFSSEVINVSGLPKTYWNNYAPIFQGNSINSAEISDKEFKQITGKDKSECYAYSVAVFNLETTKQFWTGPMEQPLPTEEEIISMYGSWDNWAKAVIDAELGEFAVYNKDWTGKVEDVPDLSKYFDVSKEFKINNIIKNTNPMVFHGYSEEMEVTLDLNVIGNTSILNGFGHGFGEAGMILMEAGITNITNDDFLVEYGNVIIEAEAGMTVTYGLINFVVTDLSLVNKYTTYTPTTFTPKLVDQEFSVAITEETIEESGIKLINGAYSSHNSSGRELVSIIKIHAPENIESTYVSFSPTMDNGYYYDLDMKILLDGQVMWSKTGKDQLEDIEYINYEFPLTAGDHYFILQYKFGQYNCSTLGSGGNFFFIISGGVGIEAGYVGVKPEDAVITWELVNEPVTVNVESYTYDSPINYTITSAKTEQVHYLDDKFIEKPVWWFGEKEYYNATPIAFMKNVPGEVGGF